MAKFSSGVEAMRKFSQELKQRSSDEMASRFPKRNTEFPLKPWDTLNEEQWTWFMNSVEQKFESELRKDKGKLMTYQQTMQWVWDNGEWGGS